MPMPSFLVDVLVFLLLLEGFFCPTFANSVLCLPEGLQRSIEISNLKQTEQVGKKKKKVSPLFLHKLNPDLEHRVFILSSFNSNGCRRNIFLSLAMLGSGAGISYKEFRRFNASDVF